MDSTEYKFAMMCINKMETTHSGGLTITFDQASQNILPTHHCTNLIFY